jgi:hypothetical protein
MGSSVVLGAGAEQAIREAAQRRRRERFIDMSSRMVRGCSRVFSGCFGKSE